MNKGLTEATNPDRVQSSSGWCLGLLIYQPMSIHEKMTLFWANVFVCRDNNIWNIQNYNNVLRKHALGNFGEFVKAIAREPSMISYLNSNRNKKTSPNET